MLRTTRRGSLRSSSLPQHDKSVLTRVEAERAGAELGDQECAAQHGQVLHEHDHLHLVHHGVRDGPELVHRGCDSDEEEGDEPGAEPGAVGLDGVLVVLVTINNYQLFS